MVESWCKNRNEYIHTKQGTEPDQSAVLPTVPSHPPERLHSLQGEWNSEAGRGVQCVVSKFRMYFRALKWESGEEEWRMRRVGGDE